MALSNFKSANAKHRRALRRKKIVAARKDETNVQRWQRQQRTQMKHHRRKVELTDVENIDG